MSVVNGCFITDRFTHLRSVGSGSELQNLVAGSGSELFYLGSVTVLFILHGVIHYNTGQAGFLTEENSGDLFKRIFIKQSKSYSSFLPGLQHPGEELPHPLLLLEEDGGTAGERGQEPPHLHPPSSTGREIALHCNWQTVIVLRTPTVSTVPVLINRKFEIPLPCN